MLGHTPGILQVVSSTSQILVVQCNTFMNPINLICTAHHIYFYFQYSK